MKAKPSKFLEQHRVLAGPFATRPGSGWCGAWSLLCRDATTLHIIASDHDGWDHVSIHAAAPGANGTGEKRTPTWDQMCYVRSLFFRGDEWVVQFHPPAEKRVNIHPYVLHLWRCQATEFPTPPVEMV